MKEKAGPAKEPAFQASKGLMMLVYSSHATAKAATAAVGAAAIAAVGAATASMSSSSSSNGDQRRFVSFAYSALSNH